ncbi:MBL fold metallo-hydrolase [Sporosarcina sp. Te-1]|uniref:MBL fold metallo-hydrolase n=1 Tax=Sporosarcina sp. Te-1 TaxID=2818390 RepID=UPI001A9CBECB|nr:MBL fold metallo-hydrolase [Sporosarcina sp. Te-1]QTD42537.1 excalibur calcium-binding domain-containing protein [Sporosarcina sp. Te-1]
MKNTIRLIASLLLMLSIFPASSEAATNELKVHFIDVGQGEAVLIQAPNGKSMLVDGGPKTAGKAVVSFLKSKGVKKLDYVVATHPDADHIGGLVEVLNSFQVGHFIDSGKVHTTQTYYEILQLVDKKNIPFTVPKELDKIALDPQMIIRVLHVDEHADDTNDASIVLKATYNQVSFLLMADASAEIEEEIRSKYNVQATVLENGHHGSDTSSSAAFISNVKPSVAILSYGKNNAYGHPSSVVEKRLQNVGAKIYRTAVDCNISVTTNGVKHAVIKSCGKSVSPSSTSGKPAAKTPAMQSAPQPKPSPIKQTSFKNCTELRKVYPKGVGKSHPAYQTNMDRDKDGWACER